MQEVITIMDRLEIFAEFGLTEAKLKLWNNQRERLEKDGFYVAVIAPTGRKGENYCIIDWKLPTAQVAYVMLAISITSTMNVNRQM